MNRGNCAPDEALWPTSVLGLGLTCRPGNRLCGSPAQRPVICSAALVGSDARRRADYLRAELCEKWYCLYCESRLDSASERMAPPFERTDGPIVRVDPVTCVQPSFMRGHDWRSRARVPGAPGWRALPRRPLRGACRPWLRPPHGGGVRRVVVPLLVASGAFGGVFTAAVT